MKPTAEIHPTFPITAVILAGGDGRRIGGLDKGLLNLAGKPIIKHILEAITPQCDSVIINANRNTKNYQQYSYPVISDQIEKSQGPLAGFLMALNYSTHPYVITLPCDAPSIPSDFTQRMYQALMTSNSDIAVAHDGENLQPMHALIKCSLADNLQKFMQTGERKTRHWFDLNKTVIVNFSDCPDAFVNINTAEQLELLKQKLEKA
ncbi:MAG: molybdenum cofactor guanylyltransferase MobA [Piscirickettsiaceae bacterium]|nr:MAG: molybdenum cofactor guanylyltransferase MobA [Piscirickettsiaceae bacterium]PCI71572.1 MAG: molybdenum cofactor guanylyltransferase MobA [Piscirickettsiaceae bacterium]